MGRVRWRIKNRGWEGREVCLRVGRFTIDMVSRDLSCCGGFLDGYVVCVCGELQKSNQSICPLLCYLTYSTFDVLPWYH